jgi:hypothetical protein
MNKLRGNSKYLKIKVLCFHFRIIVISNKPNSDFFVVVVLPLHDLFEEIRETVRRVGEKSAGIFVRYRCR